MKLKKIRVIEKKSKLLSKSAAASHWHTAGLRCESIADVSLWIRAAIRLTVGR